jgi:hypothetical protein
MAVATWQKSTARRLVSILAVVQVTNPMLCGLGPAVTPGRRGIPGIAGQSSRATTRISLIGILAHAGS